MKKQTPNESLDFLFRQSIALKNSARFRSFLEFIARFKNYSSYNNMLVYVQNPECEHYATETDWRRKFKRTIKEGAKPMVILAPMHPVLFVYDIADTEGNPLPQNAFKHWKKVIGRYDDIWFQNVISYFPSLKIKLRELEMSPNKGGSIMRTGPESYLISVNKLHERAGCFSTLIHEIGHLLMGHLGSTENEKYPQRENVSLSVREIEAESIAYLVLQRLGMENQAVTYIASYHDKRGDFDQVSIDLLIKTVGKIEKMIKKPFKDKKKPPELNLFSR